tara:strand:- start:3021 stop:3299 length:279 start_codon:yes stop_codon:yes gene_type:complete
MCDCNNERSVILTNIYLEMAEYKKSSKAITGVRVAGNERVDFRAELSEADLAYAYEELNITDWIDKIELNEKISSKKTSSNKAKTSTEDSKK